MTFFDAPLNDENQFWLEYENGEAIRGSWLNVWGLAAISEDVNEMPPAYLRQGCVDTGVLDENRRNCRLPVMFRSPTGMKYEPLPMDTTHPNHPHGPHVFGIWKYFYMVFKEKQRSC